jgi:phosphoribosylformylglycinamidine synthase
MSSQIGVVTFPGSNGDQDSFDAFALNLDVPTRMIDYRETDLSGLAAVILPGGFSYGDHLGAGKLLAVDLAHRLQEQLAAFVADGRPVLGICNGFQVLVKAGILPGDEGLQTKDESEQIASSAAATLTDNTSGQFECRWVHLVPEPQSACVFTKGLERAIEVPVAHGEGRFAARDAATLTKLRERGQIALRYVAADGSPATYPANPNGSDDNIAGICNPAGNVLGLMPHPEDAILPTQHPRWTREAWRNEGDGLAIFRNAVRYANKL